MQLDTVSSAPKDCFLSAHLWPDDVYVIPEYAFAARVEGGGLVMSREHTAHEWCTYEEAARRLKYDSNRTALWELRERLERDKLGTAIHCCPKTGNNGPSELGSPRLSLSLLSVLAFKAGR